jgi:hypothetical protein
MTHTQGFKMSGLAKIRSIVDQIESEAEQTLHKDTLQTIFEILKRNTIEISQRCSFSKNHIPQEEKEASEFRKYAMGSALHKLSVEGLSQAVTVEKTEEENEEVYTYKVFALKS